MNWNLYRQRLRDRKSVHIKLYRNSTRMAVNGMVKQLCREEEVGFVDLWDSLNCGERRNVLERWTASLVERGLPFFADGLLGAVAGGFGKVRYLN